MGELGETRIAGLKGLKPLRRDFRDSISEPPNGSISERAHTLDNAIELPQGGPIFENYSRLFSPFLRKGGGYLDDSFEGAQVRHEAGQQLRSLLGSDTHIPGQWRGVLESFDGLYKHPPRDVDDWVRFKQPVLSELRDMVGPNQAWAARNNLMPRRFSVGNPFDGSSEAVASTRFAEKIFTGARLDTAQSAVRDAAWSGKWEPPFNIADAPASVNQRPMASDTVSNRVLQSTGADWTKRINSAEQTNKDAMPMKRLIDEHIPALRKLEE